jgi:gliding motility-associated-like protein
LFSLGFSPRIKPVFFIVLLFTSFWKTSTAQENLVPNGSFEIITECPSGADLFKVNGWFSPNQATPDFFNSCAEIVNNCSVPVNGFGFQEAKDGEGYAGIVVYSYSQDSSNYREYAQIKLKEKLKVNSLYKVTYFINQSNFSPLAVNNICFGFSKDTIGQYFQNILIPFYVSTNKLLLRDTVNWIEISDFYLASGGEEYLTIGNFKTDSQTDTLTMNLSSTDVYYFIDDVSVIELFANFENVFTPNGDQVNDLIFFYPELDDFDVEIYNRWGILINCVKLSNGWDGKTNNHKEVNDGVYYYKVYKRLNSSKALKTGFIHLIR